MKLSQTRTLVCRPRTHLLRLESLHIRPPLPRHRRWPHPDRRIAHARLQSPNVQIVVPQLLGSYLETDSASFPDPLTVCSANAPSRSPPTQCGTRRERSGLTSLSLQHTRRHLHTYSRRPTPKWSSPGKSRPSKKWSIRSPSQQSRRSRSNGRLHYDPRLWTPESFKFLFRRLRPATRIVSTRATKIRMSSRSKKCRMHVVVRRKEGG